MAKEIDELDEIEENILDYDEYFSEMEISKEEKEKRVGLAKKFEVLFLFFLLSYSERKNMDYEAMIYEKYVVIALEFLKKDTVPSYIDDYARKLASDVVNTTVNHDGEEFYTSKERGTLISANEANTLGNYNQQVEAIKNGMSYKTWITEKDKRVRHTHKAVNEKKINIFEPFEVGDSLMMFPKDMETFNADMKEIANCRCVVKYS